MKPAEAAHYNFRNLPIEIFDHVPDFEVKTPQEWMEEAGTTLSTCQCSCRPIKWIPCDTAHLPQVLKDDSRPQACVVHYKNKKWTMVRCWVLRYEEAIKSILDFRKIT